MSGLSLRIHKAVDILAAMLALSVLHADDALLVIDKPAGLLAVPGRGEAGRDNLAVRVQALYADAMVVHRLDMATSGLIIFARGAETQRCLSMAFEQRQVHKRYIAIVEGVLPADSGVIDMPLAADWPNRPRQVVDRQHGKPSLTHWRVIERLGGHTRVELEPVTGRSHQLRVHLQFIGHPVRGDALYAPPPLQAARLLLHASALCFAHPLTGAPMALRSSPDF